MHPSGRSRRGQLINDETVAFANPWPNLLLAALTLGSGNDAVHTTVSRWQLSETSRRSLLLLDRCSDCEAEREETFVAGNAQ